MSGKPTLGDNLIAPLKKDDGHANWVGIVAVTLLVTLLAKEVISYFNKGTIRNYYEAQLDQSEQRLKAETADLVAQIEELARANTKQTAELNWASRQIGVFENSLKEIRKNNETYDNCLGVPDPRRLRVKP